MGGPKITAPVKAASPAPVDETPLAPEAPPAPTSEATLETTVEATLEVTLKAPEAPPAPPAPPAEKPKLAAPLRVGALFENGLLPHQRRALTVWAQANHVKMEIIEEPSRDETDA